MHVADMGQYLNFNKGLWSYVSLMMMGSQLIIELNKERASTNHVVRGHTREEEINYNYVISLEFT